MKTREKAPQLKILIERLDRAGIEKKAPVWRAVARGLNRPNRRGYKMGLYRLDKLTKDKESVVVPGAVLGTGSMKKALTVAALRFTPSAREKIEAAGGKCLGIAEMLEKNPKGSKVRIMG